MKGNFVYNLLIQKDFLNTRSRQSTFLLTNQNAQLITHEPIKFRVTKVKIWASKRTPCKWKRYQLWIAFLLNLWEKCLKFGKNRRNIQGKKGIKERTSRWNHCAWSLLKVTRTCPNWQPEKMVEKLNRSSCLVKFCWFVIIAQAGRVEFMQLSRRALNPSFWWAV